MLSFIPDKMKYKIYVSPFIPLSIDEHNYISNNDLRLLRRIVRDFRTRGYDVPTTIKNVKKVTIGEDKYIIPLIPEADKIINTSLSYEVGILKFLWNLFFIRFQVLHNIMMKHEDYLDF